ncbi:MAG: RNase adapter RapZ [Proteobacteria bacterium]|nr:RNase adapter RapZ [Pseudomonadota bacterium]
MTNFTPKKPITFVFGHSGAGITSWLKVSQDLGLFVMDNFPIGLASVFFSDEKIQTATKKYAGFAFGVHFSEPNDLNVFKALIQKLNQLFHVDVVFLSCDEQILERRFSVTRRPHPLLQESSSLKESIKLEKKRLTPLKNLARDIIDTSHLSPLMLSQLIAARFRSFNLETPMLLLLSSFGFKHQVFIPGDCVFDVRFLKNPYFEKKLSHLTGLDHHVQEFVRSDSRYQNYLNQIIGYLDITIPYYQDEKRSYLRVAIGCTGGVHRSVTLVEDLSHHYRHSQKQKNILLQSHHESLTTLNT